TRKHTHAQAAQGEQTVLYAYDVFDRLKGEFDGTGRALRTYVWSDEGPVAVIEHGPPERVLYLETDHLHTPVGARDEAGRRVWRWVSEAFGASAAEEDPDGDGHAVTINLRFMGQY
ncbi:RHS repeat-associated core domain-containing protein, partial [Enterococcus faecalis]